MTFNKKGDVKPYLCDKSCDDMNTMQINLQAVLIFQKLIKAGYWEQFKCSHSHHLTAVLFYQIEEFQTYV